MSLPNRRPPFSWLLLPLLVASTGFGRAQAGAPSNADCRLAVARASTPLAAADKASARGDARGANTALDAAIKAVGRSYFRSNMMDDTGMRLTRARIEQKRGKLKFAATLKRAVLKERLELCGFGRKA